MLELGEGDDLVEAFVHVLGRKSQKRRIQVDVLPTRQFGLEAGAELQEGGQAGPHDDSALGGLQDPRDAFEQRGLPRAVSSRIPTVWPSGISKLMFRRAKKSW